MFKGRIESWRHNPGNLLLQLCYETHSLHEENVDTQHSRVGAKGGSGRSGPPPIDMLHPPINKLTLLKTTAFVPIFKVGPPKSTALAPALQHSVAWQEI